MMESVIENANTVSDQKKTSFTTHKSNSCSHQSSASHYIQENGVSTTNDVLTGNDVIDDESMIVDEPSSLCHTLEYIMCVPEICDVTFLVGKKQIPVHGLKAVLSVRSSVLHQMLQKCQRKLELEQGYGRRSKNGVARFLPFRNKRTRCPKPNPGHPVKPRNITVSVSNYDVVVFRKFNTFLHLGHVTLTQDSLIGLLCAASEFDVEDLQDACWEFLKKCAHSGLLTSMFQSARRYKYHSHYFAIQAKIQKMSFEPKTST